MAGALALPLNGGTPGPVVIDPLTAAGMPFALGISFPPAVVRWTPAVPLVPSVPAVRSSPWLHPAASIIEHAINTPLQRGIRGRFMLGSRLVGTDVAARCAAPFAVSWIWPNHPANVVPGARSRDKALPAPGLNWRLLLALHGHSITRLVLALQVRGPVLVRLASSPTNSHGDCRRRRAGIRQTICERVTFSSSLLKE